MKSEVQVYDIQENQRGTRLDRFLINATEGLSRTYLQRLIRDGNVTVNGKVAKGPSYALRERGQRVLDASTPAPLRDSPT